MVVIPVALSTTFRYEEAATSGLTLKRDKFSITTQAVQVMGTLSSNETSDDEHLWTGLNRMTSSCWWWNPFCILWHVCSIVRRICLLNWKGIEKDVAMWTGKSLNSYQSIWKFNPLSCRWFANFHDEHVLIKSGKCTDHSRLIHISQGSQVGPTVNQTSW